MDGETWQGVTVVVTVLLVSASLQASTGFGFALLSAPLLSLVLGVAEAVTTITVVGAAVDGLALFGNRTRPRPSPRDLRVLGLSAVPGLAVGAVLLVRLPSIALQAAIAGSVVLAVVHRIRSRRYAGASRASRWWYAPAAGVAWGALTMATTAGGPPLLMYLMHRYRDPRTIRDTLLAANLLRLPLTLALLKVTGGWRPPRGIPLLIGAGICGWAVGKLVFRAMTPARYEMVVLILLVLTAAASLLLAVL
jgi:uncharacterized membrane protein YfcA